MVRVDEGESGVHRATTNVSRNGKFEAGIPALLSLAGTLTKALPGLDLARIISAQTASQHRGEGETTRTGKVTATHMYVAQVAGLTVYRDGVLSQLEGNLIMGASRALHEEVAFDRYRSTSLD